MVNNMSIIKDAKKLFESRLGEINKSPSKLLDYINEWETLANRVLEENCKDDDTISAVLMNSFLCQQHETELYYKLLKINCECKECKSEMMPS